MDDRSWPIVKSKGQACFNAFFLPLIQLRKPDPFFLIDRARCFLDMGSNSKPIDDAVALRPTKTNLEAERDYRFLAATTTGLVRGWLAYSGLREGPLFTRIQRSGKARLTNGKRGDARALLDCGLRLTPAHVIQMVELAVGRAAQARCELVIDGADAAAKRRALLDYAGAYSGHSLRVGAEQDTAAAGFSTAAILQAGGWSDERMVKRCIRR